MSSVTQGPAASELEKLSGDQLIVRKEHGRHFMAALSANAEWDIARLDFGSSNIPGQLASELRRIAGQYQELAGRVEQGAGGPKEDSPLLPDLAVGIYDGRRLVRTVKIPDPRVVFIREFNAAETGHVARLPKE